MSQIVPWFHGKPQIALYSNTEFDANGIPVLLGFSDPLNAVTLELSHTTDEKIIQSSGIDELGQPIYPITHIAKPVECSFELTHAERAIWAAYLMGAGASLSRSSGTAQAFDVVLSQDGWTQIRDANGNPVREIRNPVITGKSINTDFKVLESIGMVKAMNVGTVGAQTITVDLAALAGDYVVAGTTESLNLAIQMHLQNQSDKKLGFFELPMLNLIPGDAAKLITMDRSTLKFKGKLVKLAGRPLYRHDYSVVTTG